MCVCVGGGKGSSRLRIERCCGRRVRFSSASESGVRLCIANTQTLCCGAVCCVRALSHRVARRGSAHSQHHLAILRKCSSTDGATWAIFKMRPRALQRLVQQQALHLRARQICQAILFDFSLQESPRVSCKCPKSSKGFWWKIVPTPGVRMSTSSTCLHYHLPAAASVREYVIYWPIGEYPYTSTDMC